MKLYRKKYNPDLDTLERRRKTLQDRKKDPALLEYCRSAWNELEDVRRQRSRNNRFVFGDQFGDPVRVWKDGEYVTMTLREYMESEGQIPMQANQLKGQVNTLIGVLVKEQNEPTCNARAREEQQYGELLTMGLQANNNKNRIDKIYKLCAMDLIIGGLAAAYEYYGFREGEKRREDSWTKYIDPNYLFMDTTFRDPNFRDMTMIGCWYRMGFGELCAQFCHNPEDFKKLSTIYAQQSAVEKPLSETQLGSMNDLANINFMEPVKNSECTVCEVWTLETKMRIHVHDYNEADAYVIDADNKEELERIRKSNAERRKDAISMGFAPEEIPEIECEWFMDMYWYCRMLAPDGTILYEGESEAPDRSHPFTIMVTPFVDGRISGYISDAIDLQILINRTVVLQDWIVRNQIKGVTMIPTQLVPDDMTNEEFLRDSIHLGNYLFYDADKAKGLKPEVVHTGAVNYDATNFVNLLKQLMEQSTSVSGAIQGKTPYSGTSAALYAQQTSNASTPIASLLADIRQFMEETATKKTKNLAKFYSRERWEIIAGKVDRVFEQELKLDDIADIEFDVKIEESSATPIYRAIANDWLLNMFSAGAISLEELLENSTLPFADRLLQKRQARQTEAEQAGVSYAQNGGGNIENPVQTEGFGLPVQSTREIVQ